MPYIVVSPSTTTISVVPGGGTALQPLSPSPAGVHQPSIMTVDVYGRVTSVESAQVSVTGDTVKRNYILNSATNSFDATAGNGNPDDNWSNIILGGGNTGQPNILRGNAPLRTICGHYDNIIGSLDITNANDTIDSCIVGGSHNFIYTRRIDPSTEETYTQGVPVTHGKILGGTYCNIYNGDHGTIVGGRQNNIQNSTSAQYLAGDPAAVPYCAVVAGFANTASGYASVIAGGATNQVLNQYSVISGGYQNIIDGVRNSSSVACIADTISGGQSNYISHCIGATISGGVDNDINSAPTGTDQNDSLGSYASIGGGQLNRISITIAGLGIRQNSAFSVIGGGYNNRINNQYAAILGGADNIATGQHSSVIGGSANRATASYATACGADALARLPYQQAIGHAKFSAQGDCQSSTIVLQASTTDATQTSMSAGGTAVSLPTGATWAFRALVSARQNASTNAAAWIIEGAATNSAGTTTVMGTPTVTALGNSGSPSWSVAVDASGAELRIMVTGASATTVRWSGRIDATEVI